MNHKRNFSVTGQIFSSKESVWKVLLSRQLYQTAWGSNLLTTWEPGTAIEFNGVWEEVEYSDKGVVHTNKENAFLRYSYWSSFWNVADVPDEYCFISYEINQLGPHSCELTIVQAGFRDDKHYQDTAELWENTLEVIKYESEKSDLADSCLHGFDQLISLMDSVSDECYTKPLAKSWNISQTVAHILLGNVGLDEFLTEKPMNSTDSYDLNIQGIRDLMLNDNEKYKSPDFLVPSSIGFDKGRHRKELLKVEAVILKCIYTLDYRTKCGSAQIPPFGYMSVYEWLNFSIYHIYRHIRQIKSLYTKI